MLASRLDDIEDENYLSARFRKAYSFLGRSDLETLKPGRHDIDGDEVYANVIACDTRPADEQLYEAHRRYYDIHYVISGEELILVTPVAPLSEADPFSAEKDFGHFSEPTAEPASIPLHEGEFLIVAPWEAHKPCCALGKPLSIRKVCVKVALG